MEVFEKAKTFSLKVIELLVWLKNNPESPEVARAAVELALPVNREEQGDILSRDTGLDILNKMGKCRFAVWLLLVCSPESSDMIIMIEPEMLHIVCVILELYNKHDHVD